MKRSFLCMSFLNTYMNNVHYNLTFSIKEKIDFIYFFGLKIVKVEGENI